MHKLIALYHPPEDPRQFRDHLQNVHLPLVSVFPGLRAMRVGFEVAGAARISPYFAVVECDFDDEASMNAALASPQGEAASADVPNYAATGVTIITFRVESVL
jgi:uncharacterized protein (TIGR02118 family)